jgi:hypothetical protein
MEIPLGIKIIVLSLCAATVFFLAARELVLEWLGSFSRFLLRSASAIPKQVAKGFAQNGIHILKQKAR